MSRPIHPETVPGHPGAVRWVVATGELPVGEVQTAPGTLGPLLEYGVLTRIAVERCGVWTWLADEHSWAEQGPRIRDAVLTALELPGWQISDGSAELLRLIGDDVVGNQLVSYIASHGGTIQVISASIHTLDLDFGGACADCPAAGRTLHERIQSAVKARYPALAEVRRQATASAGFLGIPHRRNQQSI